MDGIANEDDFDQFGDPNIDDDDDDNNTPCTLRRSRTMQPTRGIPWKRTSHNVGRNYATKKARRRWANATREKSEVYSVLF